MTITDTSLAPRNPFATRCIRVGALPYWDPLQKLPEIEARFLAAGCRGAIEGPHGSGKSALLDALARRWLVSGRFPTVRWMSLQPEGGRLRVRRRYLDAQRHGEPPAPLSAKSSPELWIVDGYDLLNRYDRWGLSQYCHRRGHALLVSSHARSELPRIHATRPSFELFQQLAEELQQGADSKLTTNELHDCYERAHGNLREAFLLAFDRYQQEHRQCQA